MAISTAGEQRRPWQLEDKLRIVAEAERPGAVQSAVARQHGISRNLLRRWREQARRGVLAAAAPAFLPVHVATPSPTEPHGDAAARSGRIEVVLADGTLIRVEAGVSLAVLQHVIATLRA
jgi:transposase